MKLSATTDATPRALPKRRTRRLLVLPLALALVLISAKLLAMSLWSRQGVAAYDGGRYGASASNFARLRTLNVVEPWLAWFDLGDARYRLNDLAGAEAAFERALDAEPLRCDVRFNLVVTIEAQGDQAVGDDVLEVTESERQDGLARYSVALNILNAGTCPVQEADGPGARLAETRERLQVKLGAERTPQEQPSPDDPEEDDENDGQQSDDMSEQQDRLEERNQTGAAERQDSSDIDPNARQEPSSPNW